MYFKKIETKGIAQFSYMVGDGDHIAVIDPRRDVGIYMDEARKAGMRIKYIFETHRNEDHLTGSRELSEKTGARVYISGHEDLGHIYGEKIRDGFEVEIGNLKLRAIHTPGHTLGHLSYTLYEKDYEKAYMVFTGDCLFMGDVGRTDLYGEEKLEEMTGLLYESIFDKLLVLGDEVLMFPAHGQGSACGESMDDRPYSTLGYEREHSEILQFDAKEDFVEYFSRMRLKPRYFEKMEELNVKGACFVGKDLILNPLSFKEFQEMKDKVLLLDIRTREAYIGGHIPGSIYMSKKNISAFLGAIFKIDQKILFVVDNNIEDLEEIYWYCRRIGFDNIVGFLSNGVQKWERNGKELEEVKTISAKEYINTKFTEDFILLDVRKEGEIKEEDPDENRINIPLQNIYKEYKKLDSTLPIYLLCGSGDRSAIGYSYIKAKGYDARLISGGVAMMDALRED